MTLTLTLDGATRLRTLAARRGLAPEELIDALLLTAFTESEAEIARMQKAGDELVAALQENNLTFQVPAGFEKVGV